MNHLDGIIDNFVQSAEHPCNRPFCMSPRLILLIATIVIIPGLQSAVAAQPLAQEELSAIRTDAESAMKTVKPLDDKNPPKNLVLPGERFVLWGDLFDDGHLWAITQTKHDVYGLAYLEWKEGGWRFREAWEGRADWVPEGVSKEERGYSHVTPPQVPFKFRDLNGDGIPEVLVSFNNDGYNLGHEIIMASPKRNSLKLLNVTSGCQEPDHSDGYMITYETSGRKSWWGQRIYHKWINDTPVAYATWTDGNVEEADMGPTEFTAETTKESPRGIQSYRVLRIEDDESSKISEDLRQAANTFRNGKPGTVILKNDKPYALVDFKWKNNKPEQWHAGMEPAAEALYLFEKLTGLRWKTYGAEINGDGIELAKERQSLFEVDVSGSSEAIKLLSKHGTTSKKE